MFFGLALISSVISCLTYISILLPSLPLLIFCPVLRKEVLKFADELVFAESDEHLDNLQEAILRGTLQGKKYSKVAEESYCTEGHVRDVAYELWELLSKALGEDVSKSNFRAAMERSKFSNISHRGKDFIQECGNGKDIVQKGKDFIVPAR